jgi:hypothetical protein
VQNYKCILLHNKNSCIYFVPETPSASPSASQPEMDESLSLLGINDIIKENGYDALHLPLYHPDFTHIELFWGNIRNRVAQEHMSTNLKEEHMLCEKVFAEYTK